MNKEKSGCCGHPSECAGTTKSGRCKIREDFERATNPDRLMTHEEKVRASLGCDPVDRAIEERRANREAIHKRKERRKAERARQRGDMGRGLSR